MSKVIRKIRQINKKLRLNREYIAYSYPPLDKLKTYTIVDIIHERGRCAPYAVIEVEGDSKRYNIVACEGATVGNKYTIGEDIKTFTTGTITKIKNIPEGTAVNSLMFENCRLGLAAGTFCTIVNHRADINKTVIRLPSKDKKMVSSDAIAMIGICAAGSVTEKPLLKAKTAHMLHKARGQAWPKVRGVAMNPVDHPHGGGNHQHIGFACTISKKAPEGQKVGLVGARTTGRGKKTALKKRNVFKKEITLIEIGMSSQDRLQTVETEKTRKYDALADKLSCKYRCKVIIIPYVMALEGIVTKFHRKHRADIGLPITYRHIY